MSCTCSLDVDMDCTVERFKDKIVKAKKTHKCGECGDTIFPGNKYEYSKGKAMGEWWTNKTCLLCVEIRDCFCCSWYYGQVYDAIGEIYNEITIADMNELSDDARYKLAERMGI